jgi:UbiD family decarboxylase
MTAARTLNISQRRTRCAGNRSYRSARSGRSGPAPRRRAGAGGLDDLRTGGVQDTGDGSLPAADLRAFLARLDADGQLLRVRREVDPRFELPAVTKRIQQTTNLPVLFERVRGTAFRVLSNAYGHYGIVARLLGTDVSGVAATWAALMADAGARLLDEPAEATPPTRDVSLADVPHLQYCEKDAGPYLTASVVLARDPETGVENLSYHRMQMIDATELRARLSPAGDLFRIQQKAERLGKSVPVAVLVGNPPAINLAAAAAIPAGTSELALAECLPAGSAGACATVDPVRPKRVHQGEIWPTCAGPGRFGGGRTTTSR